MLQFNTDGLGLVCPAGHGDFDEQYAWRPPRGLRTWQTALSVLCSAYSDGGYLGELFDVRQYHGIRGDGV